MSVVLFSLNLHMMVEFPTHEGSGVVESVTSSDWVHDEESGVEEGVTLVFSTEVQHSALCLVLRVLVFQS